MTVNKHIVTTRIEGSGNMESRQAVCVCGWRGPKRYAYNDDQSFQVRRDIARHESSVFRPTTGDDKDE